MTSTLPFASTMPVSATTPAPFSNVVPVLLAKVACTSAGNPLPIRWLWLGLGTRMMARMRALDSGVRTSSV